MSLKLGEVKTIEYEAENRTDKPVTGTAAFNIAPLDAGVYFNKIQCFCFSRSVAEAGRARHLAGHLLRRPEDGGNADLATTTTITLSYTFYPAQRAASPVASAAVPAPTGG